MKTCRVRVLVLLLAGVAAVALPGAAMQDGGEEPVVIRGSFAISNTGLFASIAEPFVMLEDLAGLVHRDYDFTFPALSQVTGPIFGDLVGEPEYAIHLPSRPAGTFVDVDNDGEDDAGVQVFAVAVRSNTFGDPFLDAREAAGWSTSLSSLLLDPESEGDVIGGVMVVWAPDDAQAFPAGYGDDGLLFTGDDPVAPLPAGYSLVNLDGEPFRFWKEAEPTVTLHEGAVAVKDLSDLSFTEAFEAFYARVSREYPFTEMKGIDWDVLYDRYTPLIEQAELDDDLEQFAYAVRAFLWSIPDGHISMSFTPQMSNAFLAETAGGYGMVIHDTDDGRVLVTYMLPDGPAQDAGIEVGAEIVEFGGVPIAEALDAVVPWSGPFSTGHSLRLQQLRYLVRGRLGDRADVGYLNPGERVPRVVTLLTVPEQVTWNRTSIFAGSDRFGLPVEFDVLESGLGYVRIDSFGDDNNLAARVFERALQTFRANFVPGVIVDLRHNGGGDARVAAAFAGYFIDEAAPIATSYYYNDNTGAFEPRRSVRRVLPADWQYEGEVALLVGPNCHSACEGFAYMLSHTGRASLVVGMYPTDGIFGEVGRGSYLLPGNLRAQVPTGRPVGPDGEIIIEGVGVAPNVRIPRTRETLVEMWSRDLVMERAVEELTRRLTGGE